MKKFIVLFMAVLLASMLIGCGKDEQSDPSDIGTSKG